MFPFRALNYCFVYALLELLPCSGCFSLSWIFVQLFSLSLSIIKFILCRFIWQTACWFCICVLSCYQFSDLNRNLYKGQMSGLKNKLSPAEMATTAEIKGNCWHDYCQSLEWSSLISMRQEALKLQMVVDRSN